MGYIGIGSAASRWGRAVALAGSLARRARRAIEHIPDDGTAQKAGQT